MDSERLLHDFGPVFVFVNVLLERLGLPIPAMPTMIVGAAAAAAGAHSMAALFVLSVLACVIGDGTWYALGRWYGVRVLRLLCRLSLSPDSCVQQTSSHFERWGPWTVFLGKFIPGVAHVAPPLAGVARMSVVWFLLLTAAGSALWVGLCLVLGALFRRQVSEMLDKLEDWGLIAGIVIGVVLAAYIGFKWWERRRFYKSVRMARITVDELRSLMHGQPKPLVIDLRGASERTADGRAIPGAQAFDLAEVERRLAGLPRDRDIIFYCNCPNEASAAMAAKALHDLGYPRVRPLLGGLEAWIAAGYEFEPVTRTPG